MGDRAIIYFQNRGIFSPGIYLHSDGSDAPDWIRAAMPHLRRGDAGYSAARFCGCCHAWIDGNMGLGLVDPPTEADIKNKFKDNEHEPTFLVDMDTGQVSGFGGAKSFTIDNFEKVCPA